MRRARGGLRETALVWFAVCAVAQAVQENKAIPDSISLHVHKVVNFDVDVPIRKLVNERPQIMHATIGYPRLYQGWGMFAPNPITDDGTVVVDAYTIDGRRIDPFTGKEPELDLTHAQGLGLGQIQQDYFNRIRLDQNQVFRQGLADYLRAWHLRTGRPQDELVAFDVYWVRDQCPRPGEDKPYANEDIPILTWRKPGYRRPHGAPQIPPSPQLKSADTPQPPEKPNQPRSFFGIRLPSIWQ